MWEKCPFFALAIVVVVHFLLSRLMAGVGSDEGIHLRRTSPALASASLSSAAAAPCDSSACCTYFI